MGRFLVVFLSFIFSLNANAIVPSGVPAIILGSAVATPAGTSIFSPSSLPILNGTTGTFHIHAGKQSNLVADDFYPFYRDGALFQVSTASNVNAYCFNLQVASSVVSENFQLLSATATFAIGAASITGGVYESGVVNVYSHQTSNTTAGILFPISLVYKFGNSTWPGVQVAASVGYDINMDCIQQ